LSLTANVNCFSYLISTVLVAVFDGRFEVLPPGESSVHQAAEITRALCHFVEFIAVREHQLHKSINCRPAEWGRG